MEETAVSAHIVHWLKEYVENAKMKGFVVGISGGVDSALTSVLCALTEKEVILVNMPIRQTKAEYTRAHDHISDLKNRFSNVRAYEINLTETFSVFEAQMPFDIHEQQLAMANSRARLRMTTLYAIAQANQCLVVGTGNKVEDFGVGFFTKYGDGGVDLSPIADLTKTEVWKLSKKLKVIDSIVEAKPTDGLFADGRSDEDQLGASYPELEWAMTFEGDEKSLTDREKEVLQIFRILNTRNKHKIEPIPVCHIPDDLRES